MKKLIIIGILLLFVTPMYAEKADTSQITSREVYRDVKDVLKSLGETLKVGSEHVYGVLVRQQIVQSISTLLMYLILVPIIILAFKKVYQIVENDNDYNPLYIIPTILSIIVLIGFMIDARDIVTGFVNPEYGAIKQIMELIKK